MQRAKNRYKLTAQTGQVALNVAGNSRTGRGDVPGAGIPSQDLHIRPNSKISVKEDIVN